MFTIECRTDPEIHKILNSKFFKFHKQSIFLLLSKILDASTAWRIEGVISSSPFNAWYQEQTFKFGLVYKVWLYST